MALITHAISADECYRSDEWLNYFDEVVSDKYSFDRCLKNDGTTTVTLSSFNGQQFVVKRFNTKNRWHFLRRPMQISRAKNCYHMAKRYLGAEISTPEPIAFIQERYLFCKLRSWYVCRHQTGDLLSDHLTDSTVLPAELNITLTTLFNRLAALSLSHGDMKATNLIVDEFNAVHLIDLDAARAHRGKKSWLKAITKDWNRLLKNWHHGSAVYQSLQKIREDFFVRQL
ncbi:MAG: tRNA A-37 threonylcarbamoyl transferase component Bud32 [Gammaproteobacteria bacterium]|jgi:tRNA A-37 threonylcarbamoyl transferase component Bud32